MLLLGIWPTVRPFNILTFLLLTSIVTGLAEELELQRVSVVREILMVRYQTVCGLGVAQAAIRGRAPYKLVFKFLLRLSDALSSSDLFFGQFLHFWPGWMDTQTQERHEISGAWSGL